MDNKLIKVNSDIKCLDDFSEMCLERLRVNMKEALAERAYSFERVWCMIAEGMDSLLWKNRMTNVEVRVYDNFNKFNQQELDNTDIQCGSLTKIRSYIGVTNVRTSDKLSFKEAGIVRHVLFGNPDKICAVAYRQLDTSDIQPHRDVLAVYLPKEFRKREIIQEDTLSKPEVKDVEVLGSEPLTMTGKVGRFTKIYEE